VPKLPNAGIGPKEENIAPWNLVIPTGIVIALLALYLTRKKRTIS